MNVDLSARVISTDICRINSSKDFALNFTPGTKSVLGVIAYAMIRNLIR